MVWEGLKYSRVRDLKPLISNVAGMHTTTAPIFNHTIIKLKYHTPNNDLFVLGFLPNDAIFILELHSQHMFELFVVAYYIMRSHVVHEIISGVLETVLSKQRKPQRGEVTIINYSLVPFGCLQSDRTCILVVGILIHHFSMQSVTVFH